MPHVIRLHGPWQYRVLECRGESSDETVVASVGDHLSGRMQVPGNWSDCLGGDFVGRVICQRNFHRPTGLEDVEHVLLIVDRVGGSGCVRLNGRLLGEIHADGEQVRFDVLPLLELRNRLEIEIERFFDEGQAKEMLGEVALEIKTS